MDAFYKNIIHEKMDRCTALRQAALSVKDSIKVPRGSTHPFYWGAFVFSGNPGGFENRPVKAGPPQS